MLAQLDQMRDALLDRLDMPVQHGRVGGDAEIVRGAMHVEPVLLAHLGLEGLVMNTIVEDFGAAAGHAVHPRVAQCGQHLLDAHARLADAGEVNDLDCGESLQMHVRAAGLDRAAHVGVVAEGQLGVQPADDVGLGRAALVGLGGHLDDLVNRVFVAVRDSLRVARKRPIKRAKLTAQHAIIRVVDVPIDIVERFASMQPFANGISQFAQRKYVARAIERQAVLAVETLRSAHLCANGL